MTINQTTTPLTDVDRAQLRDLLHMNVDSRDGFAYAGKRLSDKHSTLSMRFHRYSQQRNDFCEKLKAIELMNDDEPNDRGTIAASLHRTWMELRDELHEAIDVSAVIAEAQRGESYIKQAYETAIAKVTDVRLQMLLKDQFESIKESCSWLAGLRAEDESQKQYAK